MATESNYTVKIYPYLRAVVEFNTETYHKVDDALLRLEQLAARKIVASLIDVDGFRTMAINSPNPYCIHDKSKYSYDEFALWDDSQAAYESLIEAEALASAG